MKIKFLFVLSFLVLFSVMPSHSQAYFSTAQNAYKINDHTALFIIEYTFGHEHNDIYLPALTARDISWNSDKDKVGYSLITNATTTHEGIAYGIVLSRAPLVDGVYKLQKGKVQKLWLAVLLSTPESLTEASYALQVDNLPFAMGTDKKHLTQLQLNPSELQYYLTKSIKLNQTK